LATASGIRSRVSPDTAGVLGRPKTARVGPAHRHELSGWFVSDARTVTVAWMGRGGRRADVTHYEPH